MGTGRRHGVTMVKVLFVCMGNICRSPTAQGVFAHLVAEAGLEGEIAVDSAGTHAYHLGEPPDRRAAAAAARRAIDLGEQRARQVEAADFATFDYILAMDRSNLADLEALCPPEYRDRLRLFLDFAIGLPEDEVPDPYYGGQGGFERVLDLVEAAARGLLEHIREQHLRRRSLGEY